MKAATFKKTRIAPTPSGYLHLGNILSFALTAALARKTGAKILLRIDDLDQDRVNKEYVQDIFDTLQFLAIPWDEGPRDFAEYEKEYSQLHRIDMYQQALEQLKENGHVFACTCSRTKILQDHPDGSYPGACRQKGLPLDAGNTSWRLHTSHQRELAVVLLTGTRSADRSDVPDKNSGTSATTIVKTILPETIQDFVVRKKDRFPAYQLTSLLDDLYYGVDLVVRGEDLWSSTLAQHYLSLSLKQHHFQDITFYHHPLLTSFEGRKLSKSAGDTSIQYLRQQGWTPASIYSHIARIQGKDSTVTNWEELAAAI